MSSQTITVKLQFLGQPNKIREIAIDNDYNVLDFILFLVDWESKYSLFSLRLAISGLISPDNLMDKIIPQLEDGELKVWMYHPITYRNSFNCRNY